MQDLFVRYPFLKIYIIPISIGILGLLLIIIGIIVSLSSHPEEEVSIQDSTQAVEATSSASSGQASSARIETKEIVVDVEGEVMQRGIYHLSINSRVADALNKAGGLSENADREFVQKHVNLAAKLVDGSKIYVPKVGESAPDVGSNVTSSTDPASNGSATININDASTDQLDSLPGIGQVTAQKIISGRPYTDVQDLLTKKIVSSKVFGEIKEKIRVY